MHSSRMRITCLLTISQHALPGGGVPAQGVYLPGGVPASWCTCLGVYLLGGCTCTGGVPARGCTCPEGCTCPGTPTVNRMTDRCKNITLVKMHFYYYLLVSIYWLSVPGIYAYPHVVMKNYYYYNYGWECIYCKI